MKFLKQILILILTLSTLSALISCTLGNAGNAKRVGVLLLPGTTEAIRQHRQEAHDYYVEYTHYDNLTDALAALERGEIDVFGSEGAAAQYIALRHNNMILTSSNDNLQIDHAMMTTTDKKAVFDILDGSIRAMKADGTLKKLVQDALKAYIETDPVAEELPYFDGATTIAIGYTGDVPPMDYVTSNGAPAGFSSALLTEIANRARVNIALIPIESGERSAALASGMVDAVLWTRSVRCADCQTTWNEPVDGALITESYLSQPAIDIALKK